MTPGVETTTGPLGQGLANAVGMAIAERVLAAEFNRPGYDDRRSPHLRVPRRRLPDGRHLARSVLARRHAGAGQADRVLRRQRHLDRLRERRRCKQLVHRRHAEALRSLRLARDPRTSTATMPQRSTPRSCKRESRTARPTLICCKTVIAKGAPNKANTGAAHGAPLGEKEVAATRENIGWKHPPFEIPAAGLRRLGRARARRASSKRSGTQASPRMPKRIRRRPRSSGAAWRASCRRDWRRRCATRCSTQVNAQGGDDRHAQGFAERASRRWRRCCRS